MAPTLGMKRAHFAKPFAASKNIRCAEAQALVESLSIPCLQSFQLLQQVLAFGYGARRATYGVTDHAILVDNECRTPVHAAFFVEYSIGLADRAVGPVVGEQGKRQTTQLFRPHFEAG